MKDCSQLAPIEILKEIVDSNGECQQLPLATCLTCPLAKFKMRPDGSGWLSCFDATGASSEATEEAQALRYKESANKAMADLTLEGAIKDEPDTSDQ